MIFNYKKNANFLIYGGICGIVLAITFLKLSGFCFDFPGDGCGTGTPIKNSIVLYHTIYYCVNALILISSGIFLKKKNKIGFCLFFVALTLIMVSLFIPSDFGLEKTFSGINSLFLGTFVVALVGGLVTSFTEPVFVYIIPAFLLFWVSIISTSFRINEWYELLWRKRDAEDLIVTSNSKIIKL